MAVQRKSLPLTASNIHKKGSARRGTRAAAGTTARRGARSSAATTARGSARSSAAATAAARGGARSSAAATQRGARAAATAAAQGGARTAVHAENKKIASLTAPERRYREVLRARIILGCVILAAAAVIIAVIVIPKKKTVIAGQLRGVNSDVLQYADAVAEACRQFDIEEYSTLMLAVMQQESSGQGTDVFQCSESPFNTEYSNAPGSITDVSYSISVGAQTFAYCLEQAGCKSPSDTEALKTALQEYNFGSDYAGWAIANYGGYSEENAFEFSEKMKAELGWSAYGDPLYVPHVLQYIDLS